MAQKYWEMKLRLNDRDAALLTQRATKAGLTKIAYLRKRIREEPIIEKPARDIAELLRVLMRIETRLLSIYLTLQSKGQLDTAAYWETVKWLQSLEQQLRYEVFSPYPPYCGPESDPPPCN